MHPLLPQIPSSHTALESGGPARSPTLAEALDLAKAKYIHANPLSLEQHRKAAQVLPGGNTRSVIFSEPFPITLTSGKLATVTSLDGRTYLDFLGEYTAGLYGHSDEKLKQAVLRALDHGWIMGGHIKPEEEMARLICDRFPSIELVRFANSGTEANLYAITAARAITVQIQGGRFRRRIPRRRFRVLFPNAQCADGAI